MKGFVPMLMLVLVLVAACGDSGPESLQASESIQSIESFCIDYCGDGGDACIQPCVNACIERLPFPDLPDCMQQPPFIR